MFYLSTGSFVCRC